jgi:hypothetical protein
MVCVVCARTCVYVCLSMCIFSIIKKTHFAESYLDSALHKTTYNNGLKTSKGIEGPYPSSVDGVCMCHGNMIMIDPLPQRG